VSRVEGDKVDEFPLRDGIGKDEPVLSEILNLPRDRPMVGREGLDAFDGDDGPIGDCPVQ
jgi:hypothetical protein